jgi:hypothetical protein
MKHNHYTQVCFSFQERRVITAQFSGGSITTDAGLLPIREYDERIRFTERASQILKEWRLSYLVDHELVDLLRQRLYGIIAGYEDTNDAALLRNDPTLITIRGRDDLETPLASQPTLSRFENMVSAREVAELNRFLLEHYLNRRVRHRPAEIIIDGDSTDDPAHGGQQLVLFNGFYGQYMYHPLFFFDGETGDLLGVRLRPGNVHGSHRLMVELTRIVKRLRARWPKVRLLFRSDAAAVGPKTYCQLEALEVDYLIRLPKNRVLERRVRKLIRRVKGCYQRCGEPVVSYSSFWYRARSWRKRRRVLVKVSYDGIEVKVTFIVTSRRRGRARALVELHEARGRCENWIKELKNGLYCDRLSCSRYITNAFRLTLSALAYVLIHNFRAEVLRATELAKATIETIRIKLIKVGAMVQATARRIWFHLSESWPFRGFYLQISRRVIFDTS